MSSVVILILMCLLFGYLGYSVRTMYEIKVFRNIVEEEKIIIDEVMNSANNEHDLEELKMGSVYVDARSKMLDKVIDRL